MPQGGTDTNAAKISTLHRASPPSGLALAGINLKRVARCADHGFQFACHTSRSVLQYAKLFTGGPVRTKLHLTTILWIVVAVAFLDYLALMIYETGFTAGNEMYFVLFDDMMISMRYARNLASGYGLVWNPGGERVEGFTNLLWVLYMALWHTLPIAASKMSLPIQVTGAVLLAANALLVGRFVRELIPEKPYVAIAAFVMCAAYYPLNMWGVIGTEVPLLAAMTTAGMLLRRRVLDGRIHALLLYALLGTGSLVRLDFIIVYVFIWAWLMWFAPSAHRRQHLLLGASVLAICVGGQTLFRVLYYGDPLPNTYYLKMSGFPVVPRVTRGVGVLWDYAWRFGVVLFVLPFALLPWTRRHGAVGIAVLFVLQCLYSVWVGGDSFENYGCNRFVCVAKPMFWVLVALGVSAVLDQCAGLRPQLRSMAAAGLVLLVAAYVVRPNAYDGSFSLRYAALVPPMHNLERVRRFMVYMALEVDRVTTPDAKVAVVWAGILPYYAHRECVDILGKNDRKIAHTPAHIEPGIPPWKQFWPGHMKWDYDDMTKRHNPDILSMVWKEGPPNLERDYIKYYLPNLPAYLRRSSTKVLWDKLAPQQASTD